MNEVTVPTERGGEGQSSRTNNSALQVLLDAVDLIHFPSASLLFSPERWPTLHYSREVGSLSRARCCVAETLDLVLMRNLTSAFDERRRPGKHEILSFDERRPNC